MMKRNFKIFCFEIIFSIVFCFGGVNLVFSEEIVLKDGSTVEGKIIKKTDKYMIVDLWGVELTYDMGDVKSIDGKGPVSAVKEAVLQKNVEWDKWRSGPVSNYLQNIAYILSRVSEINRKFQENSTVVSEEMMSAGQSLLERFVTLKPSEELKSFHAQYENYLKTALAGGKKIQSNDFDGAKMDQYKSTEFLISSLQEFKRVCESHEAPKEFLAEIDKGMAFARQQLK